jgi:hypothetical protein
MLPRRMSDFSSLFRVAASELSWWFFGQITDAHNCSHPRRCSLENGRAQLRACSGDAAQTGLWCHAGAQAPPPRLLRETTTFDGDAGQERSTPTSATRMLGTPACGPRFTPFAVHPWNANSLSQRHCPAGPPDSVSSAGKPGFLATVPTGPVDVNWFARHEHLLSFESKNATLRLESGRPRDQVSVAREDEARYAPDVDARGRVPLPCHLRWRDADPVFGRHRDQDRVLRPSEDRVDRRDHEPGAPGACAGGSG